MIKKFNKIEKTYSVENIENDFSGVWGYLRVVYHVKIIDKLIFDYNKKKKLNRIKNLFKELNNSIYGFRNWFKGYEYIIFSDSSAKKKINNSFLDIRFEEISRILGYNKCLYIDTPVSGHIDSNKLNNYYIVSMKFINLIIRIIKLFRLNFLFKIKNISILDQINIKENLNIDYKNKIIDFKIEKTIFKIMFKIYKPKVIFLSCYYSKQNIIKAANELNIKTIEMQHGIIGSEHFAYNINKLLDKSFFPDILLTYGEFDKNILENNLYNPFNKIIPVGNYLLESIKELPIPFSLDTLTSKYKYSISISTQYTVEKELLKFILEVSSKFDNIGFFFSLRHYDKEYYNKFNLTNNIYIFQEEYNCYDIMKSCNIHLSVYSTCALEALFFNKKVILVNIKNLSQDYIPNILNKSLYIVNSISEFEKVVMSNEYKLQENSLYKSNYKNNIDTFLKEYVY